MNIDSNKVKNLAQSALFNTISCFFNNLIYLVIIHYLSLNPQNLLQQNGISKQFAYIHKNSVCFCFIKLYFFYLKGLALCLTSIIFDPIIFATANGLKILYSQYYANQDRSGHTNKNILLYQAIAFNIIVGFAILVFLFTIYDLFFNYLGYDQAVVDMSKIGFIYIFLSKMVFLFYEYPRAYLLGLKVFGPFAYFQTSSFVLTTFVSELFHQYSEVGIHEAGFLFILHDALKVVILFVYNKKYNISQELVEQQNHNHHEQSFQSTIKLMIKEKAHIKELVLYIRPLMLIILIEVTFFNASIILSGKYSQELIVAAVCFQMTNTLVFKGISGLSESIFSFCGTTFAARDYKGSKEYLIYGIALLLIYEFLFILGLFVFSDAWVSSFTKIPEIIDLINSYKFLYIITIPVDGTQVLLGAYLQVLEKKNFVFKVEIFTYIIFGIPFMILLGDILEMKLGGIWIAIVNYFKAIKNLDYDEQYQIVIANKNLVEVKTSSDSNLRVQLLRMSDRE